MENYCFRENENPEKLLDVYPNMDFSLLPTWIKNDIEHAMIVGKNKMTIVTPDGRRYNLKNKLNHLSGSEWTFFINSVINTNYKTKGKDNCAFSIRKIHPSPKPPMLMKDIIEFFTKENEVVLDYFMGVGGSLIGASLCNRYALGIDLEAKYIDTYKKASESMNLPLQQTIVGDSMELLNNEELINNKLNGKKVALILIDPPYGDMMKRPKTGADIKVYGKEATPFTNSDLDLGNMCREEFLDKLKQSIEISLKYLKMEGHIVIFIKDIQPSGKKVNLLHSDIINKLNEIPNIYYKGLKIWADQSAKLFPYGYPFSFVANQIHQYILIFRKEKER